MDVGDIDIDLINLSFFNLKFVERIKEKLLDFKPVVFNMGVATPSRSLAFSLGRSRKQTIKKLKKVRRKLF